MIHHHHAARATKFLRYLSALVLFITIWILWPRDLGGFYTLGRDGSLAVPDYAMTNARYVSVKDGKVEMESQSKDAAFDMIVRRMDAKDVTAFFYNQEGKKTKVTADHASYFLEDRKMHLQDNVRSESEDGFVMRGPEADYTLDKRFFVAAKPVEGEAKEKDLKVWGNRAESLLDSNKVTLIGDARAAYTEQKHGLTTVRGDKAEMDREKEKVRFEQNVVVTQEKMVGTSHFGELFYSRKESGVRYMSLTEDVRIVEAEKGRYTRSQVAEFFAPTDTIVLSGFPSVYHGDDAVTGDKITLYRATGVVEVTATNAAGNPQAKGAKPPKAAPPPALTKEDEELIP